MYRQQGSWEDALRVAKVMGGLDAAKQVGRQLKRKAAHCFLLLWQHRDCELLAGAIKQCKWGTASCWLSYLCC